jgi:hypothetical protein
MMYEFKSHMVTVNRDWGSDELEETCNEWAKEGWEVFSVVCPQPSNWSRYRLTAKRTLQSKANIPGRKFR